MTAATVRSLHVLGRRRLKWLSHSVGSQSGKALAARLNGVPVQSASGAVRWSSGSLLPSVAKSAAGLRLANAPTRAHGSPDAADHTNGAVQ